MPMFIRAVITMAIAYVVVGGIFMLASHYGVALGTLPGDYNWSFRHFHVFVPLGTCLVVSIAVSIAMYFVTLIMRH